jgi:outer membrane protein assembly factor BamB
MPLHCHRRDPLLALVLTLAAVCFTQSAFAQEWTRFRGPNGSGQSETMLPASWTEDEVLWKVPLPGKGNASPVLWGDNVFVLSANPEDGTRHVLCLSAADGKLRWKQDFASTLHPIHQANTLASSTPAVDDERVYCAWSTPDEFTLVALKHDGSPAWKANLGPFASQHGFGTSPIVFEDLLIIANDQDADSFIIAVDRASGVTRWKTPRRHLPEQNTCYTTPCIYKPARGPAELITCSRAHGVSSLDPRTGKSNWDAEVLTARAVSSPIVLDDTLIATCGSGNGDNRVVALRPHAGSEQPEVAYTLDKATAPYVPSPVAKGDLVFLWSDRGIVSCIDGKTGDVHWRERVGGNFYGSPVRAGNYVYCIADNGDVVSVGASETFELAGRSSLGETTRSTPAVAGGRMYLRSESHLVAVGPK